MSFIIGVIVLIAVAIIGRALRQISEVVDWIVYLLILIAFIAVWISEGFWMGLLTGFVGCVAAYIFFGIGGSTDIEESGRKYRMTCQKCGHDDLEITDRTPTTVTARCRRCKQVQSFILNH